MRILKSIICVGGSFVALASNIGAQKPPPVRRIDRPIATSGRDFRSFGGILHLPNGSALVNDASNRRLVLLDSTLTKMTVISDSTTGSANSYGSGPGGLLRYTADSSLLVLPRIPSMFVVDPTGHIVRVMSIPRPQDALAVTSSLSGVSGIDAQGRWVYPGQRPPASRPNVVPGGPPGMMTGSDSAPIVRYNPTSRVLDTIAMQRIIKFKAKVYPRERGSYAVIENNPVPMLDDWAVLSDGSVAIVRGQDYHIDFVNADGTITRGPKMAYAWEPLSDDAKAKLMDSVRTEAEKPSDPAKTPQGIRGGPPAASGAAASGGGGGGVGATPGGASADRPPPEYATPSDLPDYRPPFELAAMRPDADGNLWIRTTHREPTPGLVYDVVNRQGKVIDRVQLQPGRVVLGFGRGGVVYMAARDDDTVSWIEKSIWHAPK